MAHTPHYAVNAHINGGIFNCEKSMFNSCNTNITWFRINRRSYFEHFKERIDAKLHSDPVYQIIYKNPVVFDNHQVIYLQLKVQDDDDVQNIFRSHEHYGLNNIE